MDETRVAVVIGANRGIGRDLALEVARRGYDPVLVAGTSEELDPLAEEIRRLGRHPLVQAGAAAEDLSGTARAILSDYGRLDLLINTIGPEAHASWQSTSVEECPCAALIDLKTVVLSLQSFLPLLARTPVASIVHVASSAGLTGLHLAAAYGATKNAIVRLIRAFGAEWERRGVRINCACPGLMDGELAHRSVDVFRRSGFPVDVLNTRSHLAFMASIESPSVVVGN